MSKSPAFVKAGKNLLLLKSMAVSILVTIGYSGAKAWKDAEIKKKIDRLGKAIPDPSQSPCTGKELEALEAVVEVLLASGEVTIAETVEEAPAKGKGKKAAKAEVEEDEEEVEDEEESDDDDEEEEVEDEESEDDDEEVEDEDEEVEDEDEVPETEEEEEAVAAQKAKSKKAKAKAKAAKAEVEDEAPAKGKKSKAKSKGTAGGPVKVGIIDEIVAILKTGSKAEPLQKKDILAQLAKKYPDREPAKMQATIGVQVPYYLRKRGEDVQKINGGFYIPRKGKAKPAEAEAAPAPAKDKKTKAKPVEAEAAPSKSKKSKAKAK